MVDFKVKRDSFYSELYEKYGYDFIVNAGYFEDNCDYDFSIVKSLSIPCTPLHYIKENLHSEKYLSDESQKQIIDKIKFELKEPISQISKEIFNLRKEYTQLITSINKPIN